MGISQHPSLLTLQDYVGLNHSENDQGRGEGSANSRVQSGYPGCLTMVALMALEKTELGPQVS